jgi:hypothetical protein
LEKGVPERTPPLICASDLVSLGRWLLMVSVKLLVLGILGSVLAKRLLYRRLSSEG